MGGGGGGRKGGGGGEMDSWFEVIFTVAYF